MRGSMMTQQIKRILLMVLIPLHIAAISWSALQPVLSPFLQRQSGLLPEAVEAWLSTYLVFTGTRQRWDLFTSLPDIHGCEVYIEAEDTYGNNLLFDPLLPGLQKFDDHQLRYFNFYLRLAFGMEAWAEPYMQRVMHKISSSGTPLRQAHLVIILKRTRFLRDIRKDKVLYYVQPRKLGPYRLHAGKPAT
ncbi:MAG: hypothetical protein KatS3mg031_1559 [Chitinophagales bacterium]|nr:MAG: hypothetical protein KatS3mg031_1559 [Chitinophagales bacterium]